MPQCRPSVAQETFVHGALTHFVPASVASHDSPAGQLPQPPSITPPQPLPACPQVTFWEEHVWGVQPEVHAPPMHDSPVGHEPHCSTLPQPSGHSPHVWPAGHAVSGTHPVHCPLMHESPVPHVPQSMFPVPQPFGYSPQV
jgi:hypothetical protein